MKLVSTLKIALFAVYFGLFLSVFPTTKVSAQDQIARIPEAEFHMARMVYADGGASGRGRFGFRRGWWAIDYPQAEYHFTRGVRRLSNLEVAQDSQHIQLIQKQLTEG